MLWQLVAVLLKLDFLHQDLRTVEQEQLLVLQRLPVQRAGGGGGGSGGPGCGAGGAGGGGAGSNACTDGVAGTINTGGGGGGSGFGPTSGGGGGSGIVVIRYKYQ